MMKTSQKMNRLTKVQLTLNMQHMNKIVNYWKYNKQQTKCKNHVCMVGPKSKVTKDKTKYIPTHFS